METLIPPTVDVRDIPAIPGLRYLPNYLSETDERSLVEAIDREPWNTEWRRRRQPYGAGHGSIADVPPLPAWGRELTDRLFADGITDVSFDQMLVNEYVPGQGIASHRDYLPYGCTV